MGHLTMTCVWCVVICVLQAAAPVLCVLFNDLNLTNNSQGLGNKQENLTAHSSIDINGLQNNDNFSSPETELYSSTNEQFVTTNDTQDVVTSSDLFDAFPTMTSSAPNLLTSSIMSETSEIISSSEDLSTNLPVTPIRSREMTVQTDKSLRIMTDEEDLLNRLFSDYNPAARPVINSSKTVSVSIQYSLMHIKDLDVRSQIFTTTGLLILDWQDERLTWEPSEHNNMKEIIVEAKGLWRPEFAVINGAEKIYEDYDEFRAVISHEGHVHWEPGGVFKTMCTIDITYYPFDEQNCTLTFGAWSYTTAKMNLTNLLNEINLDSYNGNGEWEIFDTLAERQEFAYECCPKERFSNVAFVVRLRRRHTFYILNVILPSIMTSVLLLSIFFCTPGQKVQIGVVVLLSFRIFLLNVSGNIPKTSDHIPLLGIYLTCTMAITTLSMVLTVFVLNLHHISDRPVPQWAKKFILVYMARVLGMCAIASKANETQAEVSVIPAKIRKHSRTNNGGFFRHSYTGLQDEKEEASAIMEMENRNNHQTHNNVAEGSSEDPWVLMNSHNTPNYSNHNRIITSQGNTPMTSFIRTGDSPNVNNHDSSNLFKREKETDKTEEYARDWKRMAEIFDRLFFWLFLLAITVTTLVLFHPLTRSYAEQVERDKS